MALIPIALIARFLARRGSKAGALVVAAYCLFRLGRMLFGSTLVDVMPLPSQVVVAALYVGTLACLASPSSRAWFRGQIQSD